MVSAIGVFLFYINLEMKTEDENSKIPVTQQISCSSFELQQLSLS